MEREPRREDDARERAHRPHQAAEQLEHGEASSASLARLCHYTNLQPLLLHDNERKSDRWSAADDAAWQRIAGNAAATGIYWPEACGPLHAAGLGWENLHLLAGVALAGPPTPLAGLPTYTPAV